MTDTRIEKDSLGPVEVPATAYYGAQTERARRNFPVSGLRFNRRFIAAMGLVKWCAAEANHALGVLDEKRRGLLQQAAQEVIDGKLDDQFVSDIFQTGSGTSTNMNANEVIATRANEIATGKRGGKDPVHPNDHVNMEQSSNDVIPTAMHVSAAMAIKESLIPSLQHLADALSRKAAALTWMAVGMTSLELCSMLTWSLGWTGSRPPRLPVAISLARLAITSLVFMFVDVPLPVWKTSTTN